MNDHVLIFDYMEGRAVAAVDFKKLRVPELENKQKKKIKKMKGIKFCFFMILFPPFSYC